MEQFQNACLTLGSDSPADVVGGLQQLAAIVDKLSNIAERRAKLRLIAPPKEEVVRIEFSNPRIQCYIKEAIRDTETSTIKRVLAVVLKSLDPTGELGIAKKLPDSFGVYLPSTGEAEKPGRHLR